MLDGKLKPLIDPALDKMAAIMTAYGASANGVSVAGLVLGIFAAIAIACNHFLLALGIMVLGRLCDGLDGAIARRRRPSDFGGFLDIVLDFAFYGAVPLGFVFANPQINSLAGAFLLFSFYVNGASFLAYAAIAEKRGSQTIIRGRKSFYFSTGLAEATETFAVFALMCLFPLWFPVLAWGFAAICLYTALSRIFLARANFS